MLEITTATRTYLMAPETINKVRTRGVLGGGMEAAEPCRRGVGWSVMARFLVLLLPPIPTHTRQPHTPTTSPSAPTSN